MTIEEFVNACPSIESEGEFGKYVLKNYKHITENCFKFRDVKEVDQMINNAGLFLTGFLDIYAPVKPGTYAAILIQSFDDAMACMLFHGRHMNTWGKVAMRTYLK